jgi:hypothetical protein
VAGLNLPILAAAGVVIAIAGGAFLLERGNAIAARAERDAARQQVATLEEANRTNLKTITELQADLVANEALIGLYADQVDALRQQAVDAAAAIRKLAAENATVSDYLSTPIPADLRGLLNDRPGSGRPH